MKNKKGRVLYVGKAKSLRSRVSSYFQQGAKSPKTEILVSHIHDFDFLLAGSEAEALILENNLIKEHGPKYNIMMRDDKSYPYVVVDFKEPFPRPKYQRRVKRDGHKKVFGPFVHGSHISEVLRILMKSFGLRDCSLREFHSRKEPCLLYQIKQCSAPCVDKISKQDYEKDLKLALSFFEGEGATGLAALEQRMFQASENEEFEYAAMIRDQMETLKEFISFSLQENAEIHGKHKNIDIISYHAGEVEVDLSFYMVRNGLLLGHKNFHFPKMDALSEIDSEVLNFIFQYYRDGHDLLPDIIVTPFDKEKRELLTAALENTEFLKSIKLRAPRGEFSSLMKLTTDHAKEQQKVRLKNEESYYGALIKLQELLGLRERPVVLECYDVAIFQGSSPTASQVVFVNGRPEKKRYRHYHLEERPEGNNDFAMMKEVIERRMDNGDLPDVFVVDGGKGQVRMFHEVLKELGENIPVVGIAKSKVKGKGSQFQKEEIEKKEERLIFVERSNPYLLSKHRSLFRLITQMRDEAHRFSRRLHHKKEKGRVFESWLDHVSGIGPKTKLKILERMDKTKEELAQMKTKELAQYFDISEKQASNILKALS